MERGGGAGGANAQVQLVSWPQGDVSDKSCLGPGPFCAAGPRRELKRRRRVQESRCRQRAAASWLADRRTDGWADRQAGGRKHTQRKQAGVHPASHDTSEEHM